MKLRFQQVTGQLTDTSRLKILKREIARMMTILRERAKVLKPWKVKDEQSSSNHWCRHQQ
jgi:hypothetical protein